MQPEPQRLQRRFRADDENLDGAVGSIGRVAAEAEALRLETRVVTEMHALHPPGDAKAPARGAQGGSGDCKLLRNRRHMLVLGVLGFVERIGRVPLGLQGRVTRTHELLRLQMALRACDRGLGRVEIG